MFYENSDEPYSDEIAKAITEYIRRGNHVDTTTKLRQIIEETLSFLPEKDRKDTVKKTCQRVFQALRIDVNNEFEVLYEFMEKLPDALKPGGRAAILTFHSGEDKLVKRRSRPVIRQVSTVNTPRMWYALLHRNVHRTHGHAPPKCAGRLRPSCSPFF